MRISSIGYNVKQGIKNIFRNILFSLASVGTIAACIFLFCAMYSVVINAQYIMKNLEANVCITVFFDEGMTEDQIFAVGDVIKSREEVAKCDFISAEEAWEKVKEDYFGDLAYLAEGFEGDNPVANSASYEIYLDNVEEQTEFVEWLKNVEGVRRVNYSEVTVRGFSSLNKILAYVAAGILGILLAVSVFLIANTISLSITVRREEIRIMKFIGATNFFTRLPFVIEGILIGLIGSVLPLVAVYYLYESCVAYVLEKYYLLSRVFTFLPIKEVFAVLIPVALILGGGIGFFGSLFSTRKHLRA